MLPSSAVRFIKFEFGIQISDLVKIVFLVTYITLYIFTLLFWFSRRGHW